MLDITGKAVVQPHATNKSFLAGNGKKSTGGGAAVTTTRLANIFMSPVKVEEGYVYPKFEKTKEQEAFITTVIQDNFIFADVDKKERVHLLDAFEQLTAAGGTKIITEGEVGDYFYVIQEGKVEFTVKGERVGEAGPGRSFGDLALLYDCPRAATCIAGMSSSGIASGSTAKECLLWRVDQKTFRQILANGRLDGDRETIDTLRKVSFLKDLSDEYLAKMASAAVDKPFKKGDLIIKKGDPGTDFFILKDGSVVVTDIEVGGDVFDDQILKEGDFFGERAIIQEEPRVANIKAREDCTTLCLSREAFLNVLGPLENLMKEANDLRSLVSALYIL